MALTETSQPLSIESFSYSWLINLKPSLIESLSESFRAALDSSEESSSSFIEMDPNMPPSRRFTKPERDFDFNVHVSEHSAPALAHADEIFSNGYLLPLVDSPRSTPHMASTSSYQHKIQSSSLRRCRSLLSRKMFEKYLYSLCPFLEKLRFCRSKSRHRGNDNRIWASPSPRPSVCSSPGDWRRSCDSESSIHEAVLHCKRSFGK
ncbi:putative membrane-associated kinase regulator 6 [Silene latifolia]|uniref:putative membrane-associated kinase regulator 6 n=1 Tax=Silene latifolia TaxID=37657 RepID=UPI003D787421